MTTPVTVVAVVATSLLLLLLLLLQLLLQGQVATLRAAPRLPPATSGAQFQPQQQLELEPRKRSHRSVGLRQEAAVAGSQATQGTPERPQMLLQLGAADRRPKPRMCRSGSSSSSSSSLRALDAAAVLHPQALPLVARRRWP